MVKKVTVELSTFEIAILNQAINLYKGRLNDIIGAASEEPTVNTIDFITRLIWIKTETGCLHEKIARGVSSEYLSLINYSEPKK